MRTLLITLAFALGMSASAQTSGILYASNFVKVAQWSDSKNDFVESGTRSNRTFIKQTPTMFELLCSECSVKEAKILITKNYPLDYAADGMILQGYDGRYVGSDEAVFIAIGIKENKPVSIAIYGKKVLLLYRDLSFEQL